MINKNFALRLFITVLIISILPFNVSASLTMLNEYGSKLLDDNFEYQQQISSFLYKCHLNGSLDDTIASFSSESTRSGELGIKLDLTSIQNGEYASFSRSFYHNSVDAISEFNYFECYVKGDNLTESDVRLFYKYNGLYRKGTFINHGFEPADANGWHKVWWVLKPDRYFDTKESGYVGVMLEKRSGGPEIIYIDDYSIRAIPDQFILNDRCINANGTFNLTNITGKMINMNGTTRSLVNSDLIKWHVMSDNATVNGNTLSFENGSTQKIVLEGEFFTKTATVTLTPVVSTIPLYSSPDFTVSSTVISGDIYNVNVTNNAAQDESISLIVAIFDGDRLYSVNPYERIIPSGSTVTVSSDSVNTPAPVSDPRIKVFIWDSLFNCTAY